KTDAIELAEGSLTLRPVLPDEVEAALSRSGAAGSMYARYEQRDEQVAMALEVAKALNTSTHRAIEAGTGVGKSMAYLLPQALFALRNGVTCGVATKTNALLDQLMYHELPRLKQAIDHELQYVALKGYDHYVCLRKLMHFAGDDRDFSSTIIPVTVASLIAFACQSSQGDLDLLPLNWRDFPRFEVCATPDDCLHHKCRYYSCCMLHGVRRAARHADIVVTNHALLFCDVMMAGSVLPPIRHWVVDEAHSVEAEARHQLSVTLDARTLLADLNELLHPAGVLNSMRRQALSLAGGDVLVGKIDAAQADARFVVVIAESLFSFVKDLDVLTERSDYDTVSLWINEQVRDSGAWGVVAGTGKSMAGKLESLWRACRDIVTYSGQFPDLLEIQSDLAGLVATLRMQLEALILILDGENSEYVYYAEIDRRQNMQTDRLVASQIDIGAALLERFFPEEMSVIFTSATIATGENFDYFAHNCGLDRISEDKWSSLRLSSSYDFENNMAIYLPSDIPEPASRGYIDALDELLFSVHTALGGSVLTLFTNRRDMNLLYNRLKKRLEAEGIRLRSQAKGSSAKRLRDEFLTDTALSLFALRSFWEGFDAPGDTLRCVVIPKLPFGKPTDPLQQERALREQNAWNRYSLPEAIIDLKQAAGRLIRSSTDKGCLVIADSRLLSKRYGIRFLEALPSQQRYIMDSASVAAEIRRTLG
ncbi:MAG: DNA polymerase III subunit epsilon, partial [Coriobacteriaceae bacterium]|nr:DNA polymerase III subunit epsilon [Coriobacteriaceae bacterium]